MASMTLTAGQSGVRPAGARSGIGSNTLDAAMPFRGIVGDDLARETKGQKAAYRTVEHRDGGHTEVLNVTQHPADRMIGGMPKRDTVRRLGALPGYAGHIEGRVAENVHGGSFRAENERTIRTVEARDLRRTNSAPMISAPAHSQTSAERFSDQQRAHGRTQGLGGTGMNCAPRIPGTMTTVPGKVSEGVHGVTAADASTHSQLLRSYNPHVSCEAWIRKGSWPSDKRPTYKFTNRFHSSDQQSLFSRAMDEDHSEDNRRLGFTFGLNPPRPQRHKPGDRYIHSCGEQPKKDRLKPHELGAAGHPTHSKTLEGERWKMHNALNGVSG